ncbi:sensor histidine kinase [Blautia sp. OF03-15BH]|uniref:sensor histidine kinase n=1 Tax=Blautia sp. OF03-15BH TaxID=2292287 RepID=UPI000E48E319|nr:sensor histidine kinase [Blautia sp. OF03-15BH]RGX99164.1 sensor histidine kinase [Blautia sp. OF03-15BH]
MKKPAFLTKDWFSRHGITTRIVLLFLVLVIIPFFVMAAFVVGIFRDYNITALGNSAMDSMASVGYQISGELKNRMESSLFAYYNDIVELLSGETLTESEEKLIEKRLNSSVYSIEGAVAGAIIDRNGKVYRVGNDAMAVSFMEEHREEVLAAGGRCCWYVMSRVYGRSEKNSYILARSLNNKEMQHVGFLYMVMSDSLVQDAFGQLQSDEAVRYLTDSEGRILYSSRKEADRDHLDISVLDEKKITDYHLTTLEDGRKVILAGRRIATTGWYCISVIEMSYIMQRALALLRPLLFIAIIYVVFLFIMLYMLRKYVFRPLGTLKKAMDQYAQGTLDSMQIQAVGEGELRSLSRHFNNMISRIDVLMEDYRMEAEEKNRQKLRVLSAQLTPHFIYNALNTIKWVAVLNHQENIQKLIESLSYVLMNAARDDEAGYCVEDELKLVENYAVIQKARFMNFELVIEKDENCRNCRIRKFLLQPIIENAVVHGLGRGKIKNTEIKVKVWADEELHILVEDRGVGFDVEEWRRKPGKKEEHTNIGIHNVEEMIHMEYGENYGMWIESRPGEGTRVTYLLPVVRGKKHDTDNYSG